MSLGPLLKRESVVSKLRTAADGSLYGGNAISRGALYQMLQNRIYRGEIVHKGTAYPGEHEAIIDDALWDAVQKKLAAAFTRMPVSNLTWAEACRVNR